MVVSFLQLHPRHDAADATANLGVLLIGKLEHMDVTVSTVKWGDITFLHKTIFSQNLFLDVIHTYVAIKFNLKSSQMLT